MYWNHRISTCKQGYRATTGAQNYRAIPDAQVLLQSTSREQCMTRERERAYPREQWEEPIATSSGSRATTAGALHWLLSISCMHHLRAAAEAVWSGVSVAASGMLARLYQRRSVHLLAALPPVPPEVNGYGCGDLTGGRDGGLVHDLVSSAVTAGVALGLLGLLEEQVSPAHADPEPARRSTAFSRRQTSMAHKNGTFHSLP